MKIRSPEVVVGSILAYPFLPVLFPVSCFLSPAFPSLLFLFLFFILYF